MKKQIKIMYLFAGAGFLLACESRPVSTDKLTNGTNNDTAIVVKNDSEAAREVDEFEVWVNKQASQTDSSVKENWPKVKAEFKERSARLDGKMDSLSAETKAEYAALKAKYQAWEAKNESRESQPLNPAKVRQWQQELLGNNTNLASLTNADMRETYLLFMGIVRAKRTRWTQDDWDYVDHVYSQLNDRMRQVESSLSTTDKLKIRSLQAEYLALEAGSDAKDLYEHVKK